MGIASSSHTVEYTSFGEAVRSLANFHVKQKAATSLSSINSSQRKLSARGSCRAMLSTNPIAIATRPQGVNIISKVVNPPNGCYAQSIRGSILSLPIYILLVLGRVRNLCMLVLRLFCVMVASHYVVDTRQVHDLVKTVWSTVYE